MCFIFVYSWYLYTINQILTYWRIAGCINISGLLNGMTGQRVITVDNIFLILSNQTEYVPYFCAHVFVCACAVLRVKLT